MPSAKRLILDLLLASRTGLLEARDVIRACALFDISENNARVTLARLASAGLVEGIGRGSYRLGPQARDLAGEVATWREAEARLRPFHGDYVVVASSGEKLERTGQRKRTRALEMLGFRERARGMYVRPNNLEGGVETLRARLRSLGMPSSEPVFLGDRFDTGEAEALRALWDGEALSRAYDETREALCDWLARAGSLTPQGAARESFLLGGRAIKQVVVDPLLPEGFVDARARTAFFTMVKRFDTAGHAIWRRLFDAPTSAESARIARPDCTP